ncbi:DNA polymerase III subunit delta [Pectinatus brassicae]|uniref:DNA polymerase III subunit delta n=1 Tax=Pectinatus brassicae TaxID=862415 RepID=A0A840UR07_9FIRM|nr:DNA polymerase III subunit delta [Pectinatus brassicae]MBB5335264.1 DNA polymerase-3 subunit delta [Pectinatus brassicae]
MLYGEAITQIKKNNLKNLYLIAGEEKYLADKFLKALLQKILPDNNINDINKFDNNATINDIIEACSSMPFFTAKNIVVVHNNNLFNKNSEKHEQHFIDLLENMPDFTTLIIETDEKLDKRRKLYKIIDKYGLIMEALPVRSYNISEWLKSKFREIGKQPDTESFQYLLSTISLMPQVSLGFLDKELDKLSLYSDRRDVRKNDLINILSGLPEISAFALAEAVGSKDVSQALFLLEKELNSGVNAISILTILTRHIRQLWKIKYYLGRHFNANDIAKTVGLVPFIAEKLIRQAQKFNIQTLQQAIIALAEADYQLKTGTAAPALLEDIIIRICR